MNRGATIRNGRNPGERPTPARGPSGITNTAPPDRVTNMQIEVSVGGWEHECCGAAISRTDIVTWQVFRHRGELIETHHGLELATVTISGFVVDVRARFNDNEVIEIDRLPSAAALSGNDEHDDGVLVTAWTEIALERRTEEFLVRLEVADDTVLPLSDVRHIHL